MSELTTEVSSKDDTVIVSLIGSGDLPGAGVLDRRLLALSAQHPRKVVFDLTGLTFISSIFMGSLIRFQQAVARTKGKVVICGAPGLVIEALKRARLDQVFEMHVTVDDAVRAVCVSIS